MRISDWSSDVCSSDLRRSSARVSARHCTALAPLKPAQGSATGAGGVERGGAASAVLALPSFEPVRRAASSPHSAVRLPLAHRLSSARSLASQRVFPRPDTASLGLAATSCRAGAFCPLNRKNVVYGQRGSVP